MSQRCTYYLDDIFNPIRFKELINELKDGIKKHKWLKKFDYIACRGISGITVATVLAYELDKKLIIVRKNKHNSHANYDVEGLPFSGIVNYIIVDDLISSGATLEAIVNSINKRNKSNFYGVITYNDGHTISNGWTIVNKRNKKEKGRSRIFKKIPSLTRIMY